MINNLLFYQCISLQHQHILNKMIIRINASEGMCPSAGEVYAWSNQLISDTRCNRFSSAFQWIVAPRMILDLTPGYLSALILDWED